MGKYVVYRKDGSRRGEVTGKKVKVTGRQVIKGGEVVLEEVVIKLVGNSPNVTDYIKVEK